MTPSRRSSGLAIVLLSLGCVAEYDAARDDPEPTTGESTTGADDADDTDVTCEPDELNCDGVCVDASSNAEHCGACFHECAEETQCTAGLCRRRCSEGCNEPFEFCAESFCECAFDLIDCAGDCIDPDTDPDHCGQCDRRCTEDQACGDGQCRPADCPGFESVCDRSCTDIAADPLHCGGCERACDLGEVCGDGTCYEFNTLPGDVCEECPCPSVCDPEEDTCCFSPRLSTEICVFGPSCP